MVDANMLIVILVSTVVGAVTGLALGDVLSGAPLAIAAGFVGVVAASLARNFVMTRVNNAGPDESNIAVLLIVFSAVASIAGSLTAEYITYGLALKSGLVGMISGLISSVLMSTLMITYHLNPDKRNRISHP